ncbi:MAG: HDOD domain-containing protein [Phycisphaerae bacterium]|nr:HDOD domain-containing protein [Phycisphaerae bacterium]
MAEQSQHDPWAAGRLTSAQLDALLRDLTELALPPSVAAVALAAMQRAPTGTGALPAELLELIRCDPALTARVLRLAASRTLPAATVPAAVERLGTEVVRLELLAACASAEDSPQEDPFSLHQLHRHSLAVALAAEAIAGHLGRADGEQAFVCGLLHDLGKLALVAALPKSFRRAAGLAASSQGDISDVERRLIGADHATVGRRLAELWRMPAVLVEVVWLHHQPRGAIPPAAADAAMIELVGLADAVARQLQLGFSGNFLFHPPVRDRAEAAGLTEADLQELLRQVPQALEQRQQRIAPSDAGPGSIRQLAAQLTAAHRQLHTEAAAATTQAAAFHQLGAFAATLGGQSSVPQALEQIAELLAGACGLAPSDDRAIVVYSIDETRRTIQALRHDGRARSPCRTLQAGSAGPGTPAGDAAAVLAALLANPQDLADWLDPSVSRHVPLVCTGRWVGGVLLPADAVSASAEGTQETVTGAAAMALAIVQSRCRAILLSEQLAGASAALAASQQALAQSQALSAIGELAAGAAHELNNPLAVISGRAQLMRDKAGSAEERKTWALIADQAQRISDTLTDLMEIATPPPPQPQPVELAELLKSAAEAFSSSTHPQASSAQVDIEVGEGAPAAWADVAQIRWVVAEAITNAATAAEGQAHVRLTGRCGDDGQSVLLTVSDDGPGMDAMTMERAFTPFFSLQRAGRRQGLGLPKARRYVENNAGKIWIASQPGKGTQLHVRLPRG